MYKPGQRPADSTKTQVAEDITQPAEESEKVQTTTEAQNASMGDLAAALAALA